MVKKEKTSTSKLSDKEKKQITDQEEEAKWYHYVIILGAFFLLFFIVFQVFEYYDSKSELNDSKIKEDAYKYIHKVGDVTYNIYFDIPVSEIEKLDYPIEINPAQIHNTVNFTFVFDEYQEEDNAQVGSGAIKLQRFLRMVYHFSFTEKNVKTSTELTCENSTRANKLVFFDPYSEESGVFYDRSTGCIQINAQDARESRIVVDNLIYHLTQG